MKFIPNGWLKYDLTNKTISRNTPSSRIAESAAATPCPSVDEYQEEGNDSDDVYYKFDDPPAPSPPVTATQSKEHTKRKANNNKKICQERLSVMKDHSYMQSIVNSETKPFVHKRGGRENSWQEEELLG